MVLIVEMLSNGHNSISLTNNTDEFYLSRSMLYTLSGAGECPAEEMEFSIADRLCMRFPMKMLATLTTKSVDSTSNEFCVSFIDDPRNFKTFDKRLQDYYSDISKRVPVELEKYEQHQGDESVYVCEVGSRYFRCRVITVSYEDDQHPEFKVYLFDNGAVEAVGVGTLYEMVEDFFNGDFHYSFSLKCSTPDADTLKKLNLPSLEEIRVGEVVDVLLCSIHEPCLALIGSRNKHFMRLRPEVTTQGFDPNSIETWTTLFHEQSPSMNGLLHGQLPVAQPSVTGDWFYVVMAHIESPEKIFIRDFASLLRLSVLNEMINQFYGDPDFAEDLRFKDLSRIALGLPCIVYNGVQFARGEIVAHSADRSVVDIRCVDYPQLFVYDKKVREDKVFMLSESFNVPPQCFSVRFYDSTSEEMLHRYTTALLNHVNIGSVVIVKGWPRTTNVFMKGDDDMDLLTLIKMHDAGGIHSDLSDVFSPTVIENSFELMNGNAH